MNMKIETVPVETDVLIIGGGLAGCMAAIKARESGIRVTIAEKANTLSSGCAGTGVDHAWAYIPEIHEKMGWSLEDLVEDHCQIIARGFIKKEILRLCARENYYRMLDLEKFGVKIRYEDSQLPGKFRVVYQFHTMPSSFNFNGHDLKVRLTAEARRRQVNIINRVMMTHLLVSDGQIAGALGVGTIDGKLYSFRAKGVVVSTGRANRMTPNVTGVWGNHRIPVNETGDGRAMALRAGLPVINMEFLSPPGNYSIGNYELNLGSPRNTVQPAAAVVDASGKVIVPRTQFYDWDKLGKEKIDAAKNREAMLSGRQQDRPGYAELYRKGEGPFYLDLTGGTDAEVSYIEWSIGNEGKGSLFMDYLRREGFDFRRDKLEWLPNSREMAGTASSGYVVDNNLETEVKGLFSAGDDVGGVPWSGAPGACSMGWFAGENAASFAAMQKDFAAADPSTERSLKENCAAMLQNTRGMHWREIEIALQNVVDHYAGGVRSAAMLQRGIERLRDLRESVSFRAAGPHEMMRCLEVQSVLDNADMVMAASLQRQESRRAPFGFVRADFPEQNDKEWKAFLALKRGKDGFEFKRLPIER